MRPIWIVLMVGLLVSGCGLLGGGSGGAAEPPTPPDAEPPEGVEEEPPRPEPPFVASAEQAKRIKRLVKKLTAERTDDSEAVDQMAVLHELIQLTPAAGGPLLALLADPEEGAQYAPVVDYFFRWGGKGAVTYLLWSLTAPEEEARHAADGVLRGLVPGAMVPYEEEATPEDRAETVELWRKALSSR